MASESGMRILRRSNSSRYEHSALKRFSLLLLNTASRALIFWSFSSIMASFRRRKASSLASIALPRAFLRQSPDGKRYPAGFLAKYAFRLFLVSGASESFSSARSFAICFGLVVARLLVLVVRHNLAPSKSVGHPF